MKKIISVFLIVTMISSLCLVSFAEQSNNLEKDDKKYQEYSEIKELEFNKKFDELTREEIKEITDLGLDVKKIEKNKKIYKAVKKDIYIEINKENGAERILTNSPEDLEKIKKYKEAKAKKKKYDEELDDSISLFRTNDILKSVEIASTGDYVGEDSDTYSNVSLYLLVYELESNDEVGYVAYAGAGYDEYSGSADPDEKAYPGDDCVAFIWGGEYNYDNESLERVYKDRATESQYFYDLEDVTNSHNPNEGRGWGFPEYTRDCFLYDAMGYIELTKPEFDGGETKLVWQYCHTWEDQDFSFSVGLNTAYITTSPATSESWSTGIAVTINK